MWRYSSPADEGVGGLEGTWSIASRRSITTAHRRASGRPDAPARVAPRSRSRGSARRRWGHRDGVSRCSLEWPRLGLAAQYYLKPTAWRRPAALAPRPFEAASQAMAQLGRGVLMGPRYCASSRRSTARARPGGRQRGRLSYPTCLNRIRAMERVLGAKVLATTRGGSRRGGARLTPEARRSCSCSSGGGAKRRG